MSKRLKLFRDPVHDIISFDLNDPVDKTLFQLICTPSVQRLRRIRQLGMSFLIYHGAEHSRFAHSMGVCHLAKSVYDQLYPNHDPDSRLAVAAAALLHDVGHGPFSHVIERVSNIRHETLTADILLNPSTEVHQILQHWSPDMPQRICRILAGEEPNQVLTDMVSSQLDVDRMDYILRDGHATGVKIGNFDLARIVGMMEPHEEGLVLKERAIEAVEGYLLARLHMYKQVYLHKASRAAERMLQATLLRVRELLEQGTTLPCVAEGSALFKLVSGTPLEVYEHQSLDDTDLWYAFKAWAKSHDQALSELASGLVNRKLYKVVEVDPHDPRGPGGAIADAKDALARAGGDPATHLLADNSRDTPYQPYQPGLRSKPIRLITARGKILPLESKSPVVRMLGDYFHEQTRLFIPERFRDVVRSAAGPASAPALL